MTGMTLAKASPADFKMMWKVHKIMQNYGYQFYPDDRDPQAVRMKNVLMGRLDQLGTGGFTRVVMGCEMLIAHVCDPTADHIALKPVYGAAPEMLEALTEMIKVWDSGSQAFPIAMVRAAINNARGEAA